jgi:ADP-heptose:LPS heptosyltransferase
MTWKRSLMEAAVWCAARCCSSSKTCPAAPPSVLVLRNNDIGDLLVITPLFDALRHWFPQARIAAGVGNWNFPVLQNNPHASEILPVNAPWHNQNCCPFPHGSINGLMNSVRYILRSPEIEEIRRRRFAVGIDVLGSPEGSLLMMKAGIPYRLGVKGYAGGHTGVQRYVEFNSREHVGRSALRFAELLGAKELPPNRPQIFLTSDESERGEKLWQDFPFIAKSRRIVIAPGGGFTAKCWPPGNYVALTKMIWESCAALVAVAGGENDRSLGHQIAMSDERTRDFTGRLSLRQTFALVSSADLVICNSSMLMHTAAAFSKPTIVLLGDYFSSARQHARQWAYTGTSIVLGKEKDRNHLFAPEEVIPVIHRIFARPQEFKPTV